MFAFAHYSNKLRQKYRKLSETPVKRTDSLPVLFQLFEDLVFGHGLAFVGRFLLPGQSPVVLLINKNMGIQDAALCHQSHWFWINSASGSPTFRLPS
jgi:hypothetical protein